MARHHYRPPQRTTYYKPKKFQHYFTLLECAREVNRDARYLRKLEKEGRIPKATRYELGKLKIRLFSPAQVKEIEQILSKMKVGRPSGR